MFTLYRTILTVGLLCLAASVLAMPPTGTEPPVYDNSRSWDNTTYINAGNILMFVTNHGNFGRDLAGVFGLDAGTFYPYVDNESINNGSLDDCVLYAAGLWLGGKVNNQIRIAIAEYSDEYVPGPMESGTYMPDDPSFKVYKLYSDSLAGNPNSDYLNWPADQGAPVDGMGNPVMLGDQMLWAVYNDADPNQHTNNSGETDPLGIEIQQTTWAYDSDDEMRNVIFIRYKLFNKGLNAIEDFYISLWTDPDLGDFTDDLVGCDTLNNLFFCYNSDNDDAGHYGSTPPAVGFKVLSGPVVPSPSDTADFDGTPMPGYKNLPMTSFSKYINGTDPDAATESYNYMQGLTRYGSPYVYGGDTLSYMHSGDPVTGTGDLDFDPADRRGMGSFGPLTFNLGDSQYVLIKMAIGRGADRLESITVMKEIMDTPEPVEPRFKASIEPEPLYMFWLHSLEPMGASLTFGYDVSGPLGNDIDFGSLSISGVSAVDSIVLSDSYPGFNGNVATLYFPVADLLQSFGLIWDETYAPYTVAGSYVGGDPFTMAASVRVIGHRSGDLNLDGSVDISDLVYMVEYFFTGGPPPQVMETADLDFNGEVDISDMLVLIEYMFGQ
ncbi:MAG: dockerin type I repeat-containing protein [candidate division Zixibacteria bacterium]|nr:dockerin type I repeat-containing protein [candidate division Zixibacteria bacterium]